MCACGVCVCVCVCFPTLGNADERLFIICIFLDIVNLLGLEFFFYLPYVGLDLWIDII